MTTNDRIIIEAQDATNAKEKQLKESPIRDYDRMVSELYGYNKGYIAGATTEHERNEDEIDKALHAERNKMQAKFNESDKQWAALLMEQNDRAQVLVDALEQIIKNGENVRSTYKVGKPAFYIKAAREALEQWKSGKGKEVTNG